MIMDARAKKREFPGLRVDFVASRKKGKNHVVKQWIHPVFYYVDNDGNKVDVLKETLRYGDCPAPVHIESNPYVWNSELIIRKLNEYITLLEVAGFDPRSDGCIVRNIQLCPSEGPKDVKFMDMHWVVNKQCAHKKNEILDERQEEKQAEKKRREKSLKFYMDSIGIQFNRLLGDMGILRLISSLRTLYKLIDKENFNRYSLMCNGTLSQGRYTKEMVELKKATDKIIRYSPHLAEFADAYEKARDLVYEIADKLGAEFGDYMLRHTIEGWRDFKEAKFYATLAYDNFKDHLERIAQPQDNRRSL